MDRQLEAWLLGRMRALEESLKTQPVPTPEPPPELSLAERWQQEQAEKVKADQYFVDHLEEIAGVAKAAQQADPPAPPATIRRSSPTYAREFARHAEAIAAGQTVVVD
jgi:hypothetical protein